MTLHPRPQEGRLFLVLGLLLLLLLPAGLGFRVWGLGFRV